MWIAKEMTRLKIKDNFIFQEVAGDFLVVPIGEESLRLNGVIKLNETGALIWKSLEQKDCSKQELVRIIIEEFHVTEDVAEKDIELFLDILNQYGCILY